MRLLPRTPSCEPLWLSLDLTFYGGFFMEKIIDAGLGLIEVVLLSGAIVLGGAIGLRAFHDEVRKNTIEVLKRPTPSLSHFSRQLTAPN